MGAAGSQRPPHAVELRLEYPQAACSSAFFARVHSEAQGSSKYGAWGRPQAVSLWVDDIITVSIYAASSEADFDRLRCEDFAEVYIPWSIISRQMTEMTEGVEVVFSLGFLTGMPWLGYKNTLARYLDAFYRSYGVAEENPAAPHLRIGIKMAPGAPKGAESPSGARASSSSQPSGGGTGGTPSHPAAAPAPRRQPPSEPQMPVVGTSNAVASGTRDLSPEEMKRLFQLQVQNQELRAQLGLDERVSPEVEDQLHEHVGRLRQAVSMNYGLRAEQQTVDEELAVMTSRLTQEQRLIITDDAASPSVTPPASGDLLDQAEYERRATVVMAEIQAVTKGNIELISTFDGQIKSLEAELVDATAAALENSADRREAELQEEAEASLREASQKLQQQGAALKALEQEVEGLVQSLERERQEAEAQAELQDRRALQTQEEILQVKHTIAQEQAATEEQRIGLRQELQVLEEELQLALVAKLEAEREIGEMRQAQESVAATERERTDEQLRMESLEKELSRTRCRVGVCDEKIERLRSEADDIRARAALVLQAAPDVAGARSPRAAQAVELEALVRRREEELRMARSAEEAFCLERDEAQQALEAAKVEAAVIEQKMRILRSRAGRV